MRVKFQKIRTAFDLILENPENLLFFYFAPLSIISLLLRMNFACTTEKNQRVE